MEEADHGLVVLPYTYQKATSTIQTKVILQDTLFLGVWKLQV